jgi:5-methylcytosine-specific restriction endonuclease McrA
MDHIIPVSRGGDNSLDNCQILSKEVNQAKSNMTDEEFIEMCKRVVEFNQVSADGIEPS